MCFEQITCVIPEPQQQQDNSYNIYYSYIDAFGKQKTRVLNFRHYNDALNKIKQKQNELQKK